MCRLYMQTYNVGGVVTPFEFILNLNGAYVAPLLSELRKYLSAFFHRCKNAYLDRMATWDHFVNFSVDDIMIMKMIFHRVDQSCNCT